MSIDPANILVASILSAFIALVIFLKNASDKADKDMREHKERK